MNIVCLHLEKFGALCRHGPSLGIAMRILVNIIVTILDLRLYMSSLILFPLRMNKLLCLTSSIPLKVMRQLVITVLLRRCSSLWHLSTKIKRKLKNCRCLHLWDRALLPQSFDLQVRPEPLKTHLGIKTVKIN